MSDSFNDAYPLPLSIAKVIEWGKEPKKLVLVETVQEKKRGKPVYLKRMTAIGLRLTEDINEAEKFDTKDDVLRSRAMDSLLAIFEIREVD